MAAVRRAAVERWWMTAMEMAKSKVCAGCGRERMSATQTECGGWVVAMVARLGDLGWGLEGFGGSGWRCLDDFGCL